ncbi:uncharacterized protein LOC121377927 [Gigantopelta aegis]|uniref:uncharacterized protein LOC121377927 n=1 Tax=Gigantopelta aegis TaxID=1735272 RepID=UPI001B888706|nr:uncharacterized protein LOC121377927 [Gigantopelta aegis]
MSSRDKEEERKFLLQCIAVYRELPALWKVKTDDYSNRGKKDLAYEKLLAKYRERFENATKEDVKKKFNALRTNFRKELKKVNDSNKSGAGTEELYESTLWYYDAMSFLQDQETPAMSRSTLGDQNVSKHAFIVNYK